MARPTTNDDAVAHRLTASALGLLEREGAEAVTVRAVALDAQASTRAIYSLFQGKDGLVAAATRMAASRLADALELARGQAGDRADALGELTSMGLAYLDWAQRNPRLYSALFRGRLQHVPGQTTEDGGAPDPAVLLVRCVEQAVATGLMAGPPTLVAVTLWSGLHGLAALRADQAIDPDTGDAAAPALVRTLLAGWAPDAARS